jgi:hypothetical protein
VACNSRYGAYVFEVPKTIKFLHCTVQLTVMLHVPTLCLDTAWMCSPIKLRGIYVKLWKWASPPVVQGLVRCYVLAINFGLSPGNERLIFKSHFLPCMCIDKPIRLLRSCELSRHIVVCLHGIKSRKTTWKRNTLHQLVPSFPFFVRGVIHRIVHI